MKVATLEPSGRGSERRSRAFVRMLADMCRQFPDLRTWLMEDFVRDPNTRANFLAVVERGDLDGDANSDGFAALAGELDGWAQEKRRLKAQLPAHAVRPFGGLTWDEMESLVRRYQARTIGLNIFLLARDWRRAGAPAKASPKLLRSGAEFLDRVIRHSDTRSLAHLGKAVALLSTAKPGRLRTTFGYSDWWKLHALLFMLRHPREAYRTREVRAHLASFGLRISSLDFRRFCKRHGIRRDERAGRPRKLAAASARLRLDSNQRGTATGVMAGLRR
ncbi:MAG: hypothetical protein WD941_08290 [Opitutus sp.]